MVTFPEATGPEPDELRRVELLILDAANAVHARLQSRYEELQRKTPVPARKFRENWTPQWADKYLVNAPAQIHKNTRFLRYFAGSSQVFDVGVGPGFLMKLLIEAQGLRVFGCDVESGKTLVFDELRKELGLEPFVQTHRVRPRQPIPIPEGCDTLMAFRASFCDFYTTADYDWLFDHCRERLVGPKRIVLLLNGRSYEVEGVKDYFRRRAEFPLWDPSIPEAMHGSRVESLFCQLSLA